MPVHLAGRDVDFEQARRTDHKPAAVAARGEEPALRRHVPRYGRLVVRDAAGRDAAAWNTLTRRRTNGRTPRSKGVIGRWFLVNQGGQRGAIVNLINAPVQKGATCSICTKEFGPVASALACTIDGSWLPVAGKQEGDTFTFPVPECECSSVVLAGKVAPVVAVEASNRRRRRALRAS